MDLLDSQNENANSRRPIFGQAKILAVNMTTRCRAKVAEAIPLANQSGSPTPEFDSADNSTEVRSAFDEMVREMRSRTTNSN